MKKTLSALVLVGFLALPAIGLAACSSYTSEAACNDAGCNWNAVTSPAKCVGMEITGAGDVVGIIDTVGNWVFAILLAVAALMSIISAFLFVTAAGDTNRVGTARKMLTFALVGVAVGLAARGMVVLIQSILSS